MAFETNQTATTFQSQLRETIKGDMEKGATWEKFGGIVVTPEALEHVINEDFITRNQYDEAVARGESNIPFQAQKIWEMFDPETDPLVPDNHPYYQRKLIIMGKEEINGKYGDFVFVTVDKDGNML